MNKLADIKRYHQTEHGKLYPMEAAQIEIEELRTLCAELERVLDGLPDGAIDGGWTAKGIMKYAADLERKCADLESKLKPDTSLYEAMISDAEGRN